MLVKQTILLMKETRAGEQRVGLIPQDVQALVGQGHRVWVESLSGIGCGYQDTEYEKVGATIIKNPWSRSMIAEVTWVVRVKRPSVEQEQREMNFFPAGIKMVGALDHMDPNSTHCKEYKKQGIQAYSFDAAPLPKAHPMNILTSMSDIAGRLSFFDALHQHGEKNAASVLIIGFGVAGQAAMRAARSKGFTVTVMTRSQQAQLSIEAQGGQWVLLDPNLSLSAHRRLIAEHLNHSNIIISSARQTNQKAPVLVTSSTLLALQHAPVLVDLASTQGGNIEESAPDQVIELANGVKIINQSGYPKQEPEIASDYWSRASRFFIEAMSSDSHALVCQSLRIS